MPSSTMTMVALLGAFIQAKPLTPRSISYTTVCDAATDPNWNDCTNGGYAAVNAAINQDGGKINMGGEPQANCAIYYSGDCQIEICDLANKGYVPANLIADGTNDLQSDCEPNAAGGTATDTDGSMSVSISANNNNPSKRDDSPQWTNAYTIEDVAPGAYRQQVLNAQPAGSNWVLSSSESQTNEVQASVTLTESLFDAFTASESLSYTWMQQVSESTSSTINNNCASGQSGTLYWYPLFTQYHGGYNNGGPSPADIYVPQTEDNGQGGTQAAGKYEVVCSNNSG